jgi:hypothetical protein
MKPDLMQRRQLINRAIITTTTTTTMTMNSKIELNQLEYDNKYCLLKEESLLPLPQLQ